MKVFFYITLTCVLSSCAVHEGSGRSWGENSGRAARKGARETKNFFGGFFKGWKDEAKAPPLSPPPPMPQGYYNPEPYPQAPRNNTYGGRGY